MYKNILFAAGDVGGARTIIPVIRAAIAQGHRASVLRHGHILQEAHDEWLWLEPAGLDSDDFNSLIEHAKPDVVVFASSVKDFVALTLARSAQACGIKVLHVLDNWSTYQRRMMLDGLPAFSPDIYAVMDNLAAKAAAGAGVSETTLRVTGHPGLCDIEAAHYAGRLNRPAQKESIKHLLFASEPVAADQDPSPGVGLDRGYAEKEVLQLLSETLQPLASEISLSILPHPRENEVVLRDFWADHRGNLRGDVLENASPALNAGFVGIIGMASILLYEAWLVGQPVLSIQPEYKISALRHLAERPGLIFIDKMAGAGQKIKSWVRAIDVKSPIEIRDEAKVHINAPQNVLSLALDLAESAKRN